MCQTCLQAPSLDYDDDEFDTDCNESSRNIMTRAIVRGIWHLWVRYGSVNIMFECTFGLEHCVLPEIEIVTRHSLDVPSGGGWRVA